MYNGAVVCRCFTYCDFGVSGVNQKRHDPGIFFYYGRIIFWMR